MTDDIRARLEMAIEEYGDLRAMEEMMETFHAKQAIRGSVERAWEEVSRILTGIQYRTEMEHDRLTLSAGGVL